MCLFGNCKLKKDNDWLRARLTESQKINNECLKQIESQSILLKESIKMLRNITVYSRKRLLKQL
jgi:hypothetical protein